MRRRPSRPVGRATDREAGYAYVAATGAIGPALGRTQADVGAVVTLVITRLADDGARSASMLVPGTLRPIVDVLLRRGFRIGPVPLVYMSSRGAGGFRLQVFSQDGGL
jgi:hypothetical protein